MDVFKEYFPRLAKSKSFLVQFVFFIVLVLILFTFTGTLFASYEQAQANQQQIDTIETFLAQFAEKKKFMESVSERPIKADELDGIQTELFKQIKMYHLNLVRFTGKDSKSKEHKNAKDFNMTVSGDYVNVMEFLNDFHAKNALMHIRYLNLHQQSGSFIAEVVYTVYVR